MVALDKDNDFSDPKSTKSTRPAEQNRASAADYTI
jgi:hypothetical protein